MSEVERFVLKHAGVKGMKWGRRKAVVPGQGIDSQVSRVQSGQKTIDKYGGNATKAYAYTAGKALVSNYMLNVAAGTGYAIAMKANKPQVAKGIHAVSTILGVANYASAANKAYNISRATEANSNK